VPFSAINTPTPCAHTAGGSDDDGVSVGVAVLDAVRVADAVRLPVGDTIVGVLDGVPGGGGGDGYGAPSDRDAVGVGVPVRVDVGVCVPVCDSVRDGVEVRLTELGD
jgi:hypothetical protein